MTGPADRRTVLVTGASRGIGLACVQRFLADGSAVVGADLNPADASVAGSDGYTHLIVDVSAAEQVSAMVRQAVVTAGRLDALVNNAGVHPVSRFIDDVSVDDFVRLFHVNVVSAFTASKAALPALRRSRGAIVNIASLVGLVGQEQAVEYCASKAALTGFTKALAIDEAPHGVRVNTVCPGAVRTPLAESLNSPDQLRTIAGWAWMERLGTGAEVADVVAFLASDAAAFVTGQDVVVSGGAELGYGLKGAAYYDAMYPR